MLMAHSAPKIEKACFAVWYLLHSRTHRIRLKTKKMGKSLVAAHANAKRTACCLGYWRNPSEWTSNASNATAAASCGAELRIVCCSRTTVHLGFRAPTNYAKNIKSSGPQKLPGQWILVCLDCMADSRRLCSWRGACRPDIRITPSINGQVPMQ